MTVTLSNFSFGYGKDLLFSDLDVHFTKGVTGLLGPNGAGKTTLLRHLSTELKVTRGSLVFDGMPVSSRRDIHRVRLNIAMLPQTFGYVPHFTVEQHVSYCAWLMEVPKNERASKIDTALQRVDLEDARASTMKSLSGGMRQRAGLAGALVHDPGVIILDEPTVGLDPHQRDHFRTVVKSLGRERAVLMSTHLTDDIAATCDRVIVLAQGRKYFEGTLDDLHELGSGHTQGSSDLEKGYFAALEGKSR